MPSQASAQIHCQFAQAAPQFQNVQQPAQQPQFALARAQPQVQQVQRQFVQAQSEVRYMRAQPQVQIAQAQPQVQCVHAIPQFQFDQAQPQVQYVQRMGRSSVIGVALGQDASCFPRRHNFTIDCFFVGEPVSVKRSNGCSTIAEVIQVSSANGSGSLTVDLGGGLQKTLPEAETPTQASKLMGLFYLSA